MILFIQSGKRKRKKTETKHHLYVTLRKPNTNLEYNWRSEEPKKTTGMGGTTGQRKRGNDDMVNVHAD